MRWTSKIGGFGIHASLCKHPSPFSAPKRLKPFSSTVDNDGTKNCIGVEIAHEFVHQFGDQHDLIPIKVIWNVDKLQDTPHTVRHLKVRVACSCVWPFLTYIGNLLYLACCTIPESCHARKQSIVVSGLGYTRKLGVGSPCFLYILVPV